MIIRLGYLASFFAVLVLSLLAAKFALANFYFERAESRYRELDTNQLRYSRALEPAMLDVERSLKLRSDSADSLDFKANLLYQAWWLSPDGQFLDQSKLLQEAKELHFRANGIRQNWAFSTARLALIFSQQPTLDAEFDYWYREAHRLGVYETKVARSLAVLGLGHWDELSDAQKKISLDFIRASIEQKVHSPQSMRALLKRFNKLELVCESLVSTPRNLKVCQAG